MLLGRYSFREVSARVYFFGFLGGGLIAFVVLPSIFDSSKMGEGGGVLFIEFRGSNVNFRLNTVYSN